MVSEPAVAFGPLLRTYRRAAGLTQEALAERAGLSRRGLQHLEAGDARPYPGTLGALAAALGLAPPDRERLRAAVQSVPARPRPAGSSHDPNDPRGRRPGRALAPSTLPASLTSFVGRERELAEVARLLGGEPGTLRVRPRLLTLTGPGGVGKSRLALQVAADVLEAYPDGVWFVELAALADPALVCHAVAKTLRLPGAGDRPPLPLLQDFIGRKRLLLVLDNFEQVLPAALALPALLAACPGLTMLVTSRAPLRLSAEHTFEVPPLGLPALLDVERSAAASPPLQDDLLDSDAVRLFAQRAQAVSAGFALDGANAPVVAAICRRLDGLPLAIELAAARSRLLTPPALLARLARRLPLLTDGARDQPARHQTLRAAIAWSYDLLSPGEQALLRRLGVFVGGCTPEAVSTVADDAGSGDAALDGLLSLANQSLVGPADTPAGGTRFALLETVREFALEQLEASGEAEATGRAHAEHFLALAEAAAPALTGAQRVIWLDRLERDHDNLRAALRWFLGHRQAEPALRLAGALARFWQLRGHWTEGRRWLAAALALPGGRGKARAAGLSGAGSLAQFQGDTRAGRAMLEEAIALFRELDDAPGLAQALNRLGIGAQYRGDHAAARMLQEQATALFRAVGDTGGLAISLNVVGMAAQAQGDTAAARAALEEAAALFRDAGDAWGIATTLGSLGFLAHGQGDDTTARPLLEESLARRRRLGDQSGVAVVLARLGQLARVQGDDAWATALYEESLALSRELGERGGVAWALQNLGHVALSRGDCGRAAALFGESLCLKLEQQDRRGVAQCLASVGALAAAEAQPERAARLLAAAEALLERLGVAMTRVDRADFDRALAAAQSGLGEAAFAAAQETGRTLAFQEAVACAQATLTLPLAAPGASEKPPGKPSGREAPQPGPPARRRLPGGLTERQAEVLRHLAAGETDRQIAAALVLSETTVGRHLANIYAKLGVASRAAATAFAVRAGLA